MPTQQFNRFFRAIAIITIGLSIGVVAIRYFKINSGLSDFIIISDLILIPIFGILYYYRLNSEEAGNMVSLFDKVEANKGDAIQFVEENLEQRMNRLTESLKSATESINGISKEIEAKVELANKLNVEIKAAELKTPEVEAVTQLLRNELIKERRNSFWQSMLVKFIFFILGVVASAAVNMYFSKS